MKISIQNELDDTDREYLFKWSDQVFPVEAKQFTWAKPERHIVARETDVPIAHMGIGNFTIEILDQSIKTVGIGGVVVRPEYQKQRIPEKLFNTVHSMQDYTDNWVFSLFCPDRLVGYYSQFGYKLFTHRMEFIQNGTSLTAKNVCFMTWREALTADIKIPSEPW